MYKPIDEQAYDALIRHWDSLAKPVGGLGKLEKTIALAGGIQHTDRPVLDPRTLLVFISDNGILEEGVSESDSSVTTGVAVAMSKNASTVCTMAKKAGVKVYPIDVGMSGEVVKGIENARIRNGTRNFLKEPAMTEEEVRKAMDIGYDRVKMLKEKKEAVVLLGELGMGNTTTATAVACALLKENPYEMTGRGAGLSDDKYRNKCEVIRRGLDKYDYDSEDVIRVLSLFGGYDIAAMAGAVHAGADLHVPIILDGLITLSSALAANILYPGCAKACIAAHMPKEPMGKRIIRELSLDPLIYADIALGEGAGSVLLMPLLDVCLELYDKGTLLADLASLQ